MLRGRGFHILAFDVGDHMGEVSEGHVTQRGAYYVLDLVDCEGGVGGLEHALEVWSDELTDGF